MESTQKNKGLLAAFNDWNPIQTRAAKENNPDYMNPLDRAVVAFATYIHRCVFAQPKPKEPPQRNKTPLDIAKER